MSFEDFQYAYELSPIMLTGGIAADMAGGSLPIITLTDSQSFSDGLLEGAPGYTADNAFARWKPVGGSLISTDIGEYPFANQGVAANAIIAMPLRVSMLMYCPAKGAGGYTQKLAIITALQSSLAKHNGSGGTYTVSTPSFVYTNCILREMRDASTGESGQTQFGWQFDFEQPLLTIQQLAEAQNSLMSKLSSGTPIVGQPAWSGVQQTVGQPQSLAAPSVVPSAAGAAAAAVSGLRGSIPQ